MQCKEKLSKKNTARIYKNLLETSAVMFRVFLALFNFGFKWFSSVYFYCYFAVIYAAGAKNNNSTHAM